MGWVGTVVRLAGQLAFAASALGLGVALSRYTDLGREEHAPSAAHVSVLGAWLARGPARVDVWLARGPARVDVPREGLLISRASASAEREPLLAPQSAPAAPAETRAEGFGEALRDGRVMRGATPHRLILFTFDDGPDRTTTPRLLDRLDAAGVRAVFFLTGDNLRGQNLAERRNQEIARETVRRGHLVASHGMHHRQLPLLSDYDALLEVSQVEAVFEQVLGGRPWLIRPPGGSRSPRIDRLLAERGYTTVLWNLSAGDTEVHTAAEVHQTWAIAFARRRARGEEGGIVLLHDTYAWSVDAFQLIVQDLLDRNCKLLDRGEELYDFADDPRLFFQPRGAAQPGQEATPVVLPPALLEARQARLRDETAQRCAALATRPE